MTKESIIYCLNVFKSGNIPKDKQEYDNWVKMANELIANVERMIKIYEKSINSLDTLKINQIIQEIEEYSNIDATPKWVEELEEVSEQVAEIKEKLKGLQTKLKSILN